MHIVFIRFSSLGDVVLQTPIISWLKSKFSNVKITFITSAEFKSMVEGHAHIDEALYFERSRGLEDIKNIFWLGCKIEKELEADLIVDLHGTTRAKLLKAFCPRTPKLTVDKRSLLRWLLVRFKLNFLKSLETHHERVINDFKFLFNRSYERKELVSFLKEETKNELIGLTTTPLSFKLKPLENENEKKSIVISPVASFETKRWPIQNFKKLCEMILNEPKLGDYKVIIVAGPADNYCKEIDIDSERLLNLQGKTSLKESNELVSHAELCITNDTGVGHIAEASGVPVISLFGPTSEDFGFRPHLARSQALSIKLDCRPCSATGSKKCFKKEQSCMVELHCDFVFQKVLETLNFKGEK